jgi:hypothetical protein
MDLKDKLAEYQSIVIEERKIERELESFFRLLGTRESSQYARCADYGQRAVQVLIPYDEINLNFFTVENVEKIRNEIVKYRGLRDIQKILETDISSQKVNENRLRFDVEVMKL